VTGPEDVPLVSEGLITNRDGIAGTWTDVTPGTVPQNASEDTAYLGRLAPIVRASIFAFELNSRIGFSTASDGDGNPAAVVWHLDGAPHGSAASRAAKYKHLASIYRPPDMTFEVQLSLVYAYADLRQDRAAEILSQLVTPTEFLRSIAYINPSRTPFTIELLSVAQALANLVEMRIKYSLACKRPFEYSPQIQPMIWTPTHGSLPSGHSTESFAMARVLWRLLRDTGTAPYSDLPWGTMLMRQAARIAINRTVAGLHFPVDSVAGAMLGLTLGQYLVARCKNYGRFEAWTFQGADYPAGADFHWQELYNVATETQKKHAWAVRTIVKANGVASEPLRWLWDKAKAEWPAQ
jgi:membrane-associated phospholipid phosphatase